MKKRNLYNLISVGAGVLFLIIVGLFLSKATFAQGSRKTSLPIITTFKINLTTTNREGVVQDWNEFTWKTINAERVRLYKNGKEIKGRFQLSNGESGWPLSIEGGLKIQRNKNDLYELVAENSSGNVSKALNVKLEVNGSLTVPVLPEILAFKITPQMGKPGDVFRFSWQVKGAQQVRLYDDVGEIESRIELSNGTYGWPLALANEMQESLNKSTTYKLVAISKAGSVSKSFKVTVSDYGNTVPKAKVTVKRTKRSNPIVYDLRKKTSTKVID